MTESTWTTIATVAAAAVPVFGIGFHLLKNKFQSMWREDNLAQLELYEKKLEARLDRFQNEVMSKVSLEIKMMSNDIKNIVDIIKDLQNTLGRHQEQQTVAQIEAARISEKLASLDKSVASIDIDLKSLRQTVQNIQTTLTTQNLNR